MEKDTYKSLLKEAGFHTKNDLARFLDLSHGAVNAWGSTKPYPKYLKVLLETLVENKKLKAEIEELEKRQKDIKEWLLNVKM